MEPVVTITLAIIGVATLAVLVSRNANTAGVMTAYGQTFSAMIGAATAPVTGRTQPAGSSMFPTPVLGGGLNVSFPGY
jgi:PRD1 phage membrane DNA delivery